MVSDVKFVPDGIKRLQKFIPASTMVCLSPLAAERVYGAAKSNGMTMARAWTDRLDDWLPLDLLLCAVVSIRATCSVSRGDIKVVGCELGVWEAHPGIVEARLLARHADGTELGAIVGLHVGLLGEVPRLIATIRLDSELDE